MVTLGYEFTPSVDLTVNSLGVFDGGSDGAGLVVAHDVGLYESATQNLLASVTVDNAGSTLINGFRFASINPVVLTASQTYVLAAHYPVNTIGDKGLATLATTIMPFPLSAVTMHTLAAGGATLSFPTVTLSPTDFRLTANMLFTSTPAADADSDGVDDSIDNCTNVANPLQEDSDGDGHGSICDADLNNDCAINFFDLVVFKTGFGGSDPLLDLDSDGAVNFFDLVLFRGMFGGMPGPSAAGALCP